MKRVLRALVLTGIMGIAAAAAQAQVSVYFGVRAPQAYAYSNYVPPCPGEGYAWTAGYYTYGPYGQVWVPGRWIRHYDGYYRHDNGWHRGWDRDRDRDYYRHYDRDRGWDHRRR